jgi:predicted phosphoribosyltransferase
MFQDRMSAGRDLAPRVAALPSLAAAHGAASPPPVVLALPRGGIPVALPIAAALGAPLDLLLVRKIGAPGQPELALGAVVEGDPPQLVLNDDIVAALGVDAAWIAAACDRELAEIARRRALLGAAARPPPALAGRAVVLVDDGVATGASAEVALRAVRAAGAARAILAVPVIAAEVAARFRAGGAGAAEVVALAEPACLGSVGAFYRDFHQLDDAEVLDLLRSAPPRP